MDYLEEEEQSCVINPAPQLFGSMNLLNGLIGWGKQKRLSFITKSNNANSSSSFEQADASPKSSIEEEVSSKVSVAEIAIKQGDEEVEEDGNDDEEADDATEEEVDMNQKRKRYSSSTSLLSTCGSTRKKRKGENN